MKLITSTACFLVLMTGFAVGVGCNTEPTTSHDKDQLTNDGIKALNQMQDDDPGLKDVIRNSYAYVIFPDVGQGALGVGGAHGHGIAYAGGQMVGWAEMTLANIGLQVGGQEYSELLVFRTKEAFDNFANNNLNFEAAASAVILKSGAAAEAKWRNDVIVFKRPKAGAMVEAAIGGQRFTYKPVSAAQ